MTDTQASETPKVWDTGTAAHVNLAEALAAFQTELPKLLKDEKAKVQGETKDGRSYDRSYGYADLAQVVETVLPVLGKHGLSVTSKSVIDQGGNFILEVSLLHEGGERETGYWPLPDPRRSGPQDIGSAMTYGRRYLTLALSGTYPGGEDDDGQKAQTSARESWDNARPTREAHDQHARGVNADQPPQDLPKPPKTSWTDEEVIGYQDKLPTLTPENAVKLYDWMAAKSLHERKVGASGRTATLMLALTLVDRALLPDATPGDLEQIKILAEGRGLLNVKVSATETLEQALYEARELAQHAADAEGSQDPADASPDPASAFG